jgi:hypothetical protein
LREVKAPILLRQTANRWRQGVRSTRQPHFTPRFLFIFKDSWYSFLLEAESTPGPVRQEGLGQFKKSTSSGLEPKAVDKLNISFQACINIDHFPIAKI